jgi:molybdate transport system substrate-binding protein
MRKTILYIIVSLIIVACGPAEKQKKPKVLVFCAASLTNVISEIAENFEKEKGIKVKLNFASSGTLARQIEHGANPSLFISANKKWVKYLNEEGRTRQNYEKPIASNSLAVVAPINSQIDSFSFNSSTDFLSKFKGRLSVGDPKHVPAGEYAMQVILKMDCAEDLKYRLLPAKDVRSALMVVELGETELGIVYRTDALESKKVKLVAEIPQDMHDPILYYLTVLEETDPNARLFYAYLNSENSKKVWLKYGFKLE